MNLYLVVTKTNEQTHRSVFFRKLQMATLQTLLHFRHCSVSFVEFRFSSSKIPLLRRFNSSADVVLTYFVDAQVGGVILFHMHHTNLRLGRIQSERSVICICFYNWRIQENKTLTRHSNKFWQFTHRESWFSRWKKGTRVAATIGRKTQMGHIYPCNELLLFHFFSLLLLFFLMIFPSWDSSGFCRKLAKLSMSQGFGNQQERFIFERGFNVSCFKVDSYIVPQLLNYFIIVHSNSLVVVLLLLCFKLRNLVNHSHTHLNRWWIVERLLLYGLWFVVTQR